MVSAAVSPVEALPACSEVAVALPAFEVIFNEHLRYLWCTLRRLGIHDGDLEDIAHEVMLRVHAQLPHHDPEHPIRPWIFGIALGAAANYRRLARHRTELQAVFPEVRDPEPIAEEDLLLRERRHLVKAALAQVPLQHRAVLILHDMDEVAVPEIASALNIGINTAYSRLRLGREALRKALKQSPTRGGSK